MPFPYRKKKDLKSIGVPPYMRFCEGKGLAGPGAPAPQCTFKKQWCNGHAVTLQPRQLQAASSVQIQHQCSTFGASFFSPGELNGLKSPGTAIMAKQMLTDMVSGCAKVVCGVDYRKPSASCRHEFPCGTEVKDRALMVL